MSTMTIVACGGAERESVQPQASNASPAATPPFDPVAELNRTSDVLPARVAQLCEAAGGRLDSGDRKRCGTAHLAYATELLNQRRYDEARSALAFAQTEGAPLAEIAALRKKIPRYDEQTGHSRTAQFSASDSSRDLRLSAAGRFTSTFQSSLLSGFEIKGVAAGKACDVLLVTSYVKMEDSMIQALHRGDVMYGRILPGGAGAFASQNGFRGVVYRDGYETIWTYGEVTEREANRLRVCS